MPLRISNSAIFAAILLAGMTALFAAAAPKPASSPAAAPPGSEKLNGFKVLDNLDYKNKPDTVPLGMVHCNIIYQEAIWKGKKPSAMPDEQAYKEVVHRHTSKPGPIVLDIEDSTNYKDFVKLVQWTHEASPGNIVGFYGHGTESKELANAVDAFFPSLYTFDDNRGEWKNKLEHAIKQAHGIAPAKPVYPYLHPQYHKGTAKAKQFIPGDYWIYQLRTAKECGANGVVLWSIAADPAGGNIPWNGNIAWWQATVKFLTELKKGS